VAAAVVVGILMLKSCRPTPRGRSVRAMLNLRSDRHSSTWLEN
jgi:hypothetical protein